MSQNERIVDSHRLRIDLPRPCADDDSLIQLSGQVYNSTLENIEDSLRSANWSMIRVGDPVTLVARGLGKEMIIINDQLEFSLSRVVSAQKGVELLQSMFDKQDS